MRRAAVKTIEVLINSRPEKLKELFQGFIRKLVGRFKERDNNVKCNILEAF